MQINTPVSNICSLSRRHGGDANEPLGSCHLTTNTLLSVPQMRDGPSTDRRKTINLSVRKRDRSRATSAVQALVYSINRDVTKYEEKKPTNISTCVNCFGGQLSFFIFIIYCPKLSLLSCCRHLLIVRKLH